MAAKTFKFTGKAHWAKVGINDDDPDEYGGKTFYKISVELDDKSWDTFRKSGLRLQPKNLDREDDDSPEIVTFRRDAVAKTGTYKGKAYSLGGGKPKVVDSEGDELEDYIGNGSEVEVTVERYPSKIGKYGHRLEKVKVLELVKYEPNDDEDEDEDDYSRSSSEQTKPVVQEKVEPVKKKTSKKDLPF